jgi:cadmium resistance protein CadD (predicted permease)
LLGFFGVYFVALILVWGVLLVYASARLVTSPPTVENVKKYERLITMSMILLPLGLILEALSTTLGGLL